MMLKCCASLHGGRRMWDKWGKANLGNGYRHRLCGSDKTYTSFPLPNIVLLNGDGKVIDCR